MDDVRAVLLAGGEGRRMGRLGQGRLKPLIPYWGTSRLVDFSLANARDSGLAEVLLLSQYEERRLMDDLHAIWNTTGGFRVHFGPYDPAYRAAPPGRAPACLPPRTWPPERGTADALISKARYVFGRSTSEVLVLHADHVYRFDYRGMLARHRDTGAALTLAYKRIARRYVHLFGMVELDPSGRLTGFVEKPPAPTRDTVFAAFCVFDARCLHRYLELLDGTDWQYDISRDLIPAMLRAGEHIHGFPVPGYWEDIGTIDRYHWAQMRLLDDPSALPLAGVPWTVRPAVGRRLVGTAAGVDTSVVPDDLVNAGRIEHSVVFPGVRVGAGAVVRDSVVLPGARVPDGARVDSSIVLEDGYVQPPDPVGDPHPAATAAPVVGPSAGPPAKATRTGGGRS